MKPYTVIFVSMLLLLSSCKSHRDVSRSVVSQTRGESLVTVSDSSRTHLETSLKTDSEKQEDRLEYSKQTNFGNDNNVVSTTERVVIYASNFKINSQLDQIKAEDFKYNSATQTTDNASTIVQEKEKETADSRPIQGWEWAVVIFIGSLVIYLTVITIKSKY